MKDLVKDRGIPRNAQDQMSRFLVVMLIALFGLLPNTGHAFFDRNISGELDFDLSFNVTGISASITPFILMPTGDWDLQPNALVLGGNTYTQLTIGELDPEQGRYTVGALVHNTSGAPVVVDFNLPLCQYYDGIMTWKIDNTVSPSVTVADGDYAWLIADALYVIYDTPPP